MHSFFFSYKWSFKVITAKSKEEGLCLKSYNCPACQGRCGEARRDNYAAMKAELGRKANTDTGWQWWQLFVRQESRLGSQGLNCDEAANIPHDTEEDESSDTLPPRSWIRRLKGLSILQSAQYKHHDRVTLGCWILLWSAIYYKHLMTAHYFLMDRRFVYTKVISCWNESIKAPLIINN